MRRALPIALIVLAVGALDMAWAAPVRPTVSVEFGRLRAFGARDYVQNLYDDQGRLTLVLSGIAGGQLAWLKLAQDIKPAADGHMAEVLQASMAKALLRNPRGVLDMTSSSGGAATWRIGAVCSAPIATPGKAWLQTYKVAALRIVGSVHDPALSAKRLEVFGR